MMLGSNIASIPLIVTITYLASQKRNLNGRTSKHRKSSDGGTESTSSGGKSTQDLHRQEKLLRIQREEVTVLVMPYLGILGLLVVLTHFEVRSTENIVAALGITRLVSGLFITAIVTATPEIFTTWSVVRSGQVTVGTTSVSGDNAITMTVALVPHAFITVPVEDFQLYWVNLMFVALMPAVYAGLTHWGATEYWFTRWQVLLSNSLGLVYIGVIVFGVLNVL